MDLVEYFGFNKNIVNMKPTIIIAGCSIELVDVKGTICANSHRSDRSGDTLTTKYPIDKSCIKMVLQASIISLLSFTKMINIKLTHFSHFVSEQ